MSMVELSLRWLAFHSELKVGGNGNDGVILGTSGLQQLKGNVELLKKGPFREEGGERKDILKAIYDAWKLAEGVCPT